MRKCTEVQEKHYQDRKYSGTRKKLQMPDDACKNLRTSYAQKANARSLYVFIRFISATTPLTTEMKISQVFYIQVHP